jgi:nicotinamide mononucleotide transporter
LIHSGYIPTAVLYAFYAVFVIYGFVVWLRASRTEQPDREPEAVASTG